MDGKGGRFFNNTNVLILLHYADLLGPYWQLMSEKLKMNNDEWLEMDFLLFFGMVVSFCLLVVSWKQYVVHCLEMGYGMEKKMNVLKKILQ